MNKQRIIWMTGGALIVLILIVVVQQFMTSGTSAAPMSQEEAIQLINERYPGSNAELVEESGNTFLFSLENDQGFYELEIDRENNSVAYLENISLHDRQSEADQKEITEEEAIEVARQRSDGEVVSSTLSESNGQKNFEVVLEEETRIVTLLVNAISGEAEVTNEESKETEEPARILSEPEAIEIALDAVNGEVDDVDLEQSNGVTYFLIEIESDDDDEATVQVNAITGEVMSTVWDD
ncbi:PepSY domain-containing protein [Jeotgalibacillus salarius]|nr:PepSY domain-containing protein [Jeotgalibacillus salarius]